MINALSKNLFKSVYVAAVYTDGTTIRNAGFLCYSIGARCGSHTSKAAILQLWQKCGYHVKQYFGGYSSGNRLE